MFNLIRSLVCAIALLGVIVMSGAAPVSAQDASPTPECVAPELPPGTPTPLDEEGMPIVEEGATPEAETGEDMDGHVMEEAEVAESPADDETASAALESLQNAFNCIGAGDLLGLAALMTPNFIMWVTEFSTNPYDIPLMMEGVQPVEIVAEGEHVIDENGRVGLHVVLRGLFNEPGLLTAERWYMAEEDGVWKIDEIGGATTPEGFMPEATLVEVQLVDFAFAPSLNEIPAGPAIFRFSNTSYSHQGHVGVVVSLIEGVTAEQVIQMDELPDDQLTGFYGAAFVEPGQTADLIFENIEPGVYTMVCDVTTPDGVPHWQLGMVAQFDVV